MADLTASSQKVGWRVTGQTVGMEQGPDGQFQKGINVHFVTDSGLRASVFLPDGQYSANGSPAIIAELIDAKAAQMEQINNLRG